MTKKNIQQHKTESLPDLKFRDPVTVIHDNRLKICLSLIDELANILTNIEQLITKSSEQEIFQKSFKVLSALDAQRRSLNDEDDQIAKSHFQSKILDLTNSSDFGKHAYTKPRGYAGDFEMMEKIWKGRTQASQYRYLGDDARGKVLNAFSLESPICKANIIRTQYFKNLLSGHNFKNIANFGSGSVIEFVEAIKYELDSSPNLTLFDQEPEAIAYAKESLKHFDVSVKSVQGNIVKTILKTTPNSFDCIYSSGLLDYFSVSASQRLVEKLWNALQPGGWLLIANAHPNHTTRVWMEYAGEWYLDYKTESEMISLVQNLPNLSEMMFKIDKYGVYQFTYARKG